MSDDKPFAKSFTCAAVLYGALIIWMMLSASDDSNTARRAGYMMSGVLMPAIITGIWGRISSKSWGWGRFIVTYGLMWLFCAFLQTQGAAHR